MFSIEDRHSIASTPFRGIGPPARGTQAQADLLRRNKGDAEMPPITFGIATINAVPDEDMGSGGGHIDAGAVIALALLAGMVLLARSWWTRQVGAENAGLRPPGHARYRVGKAFWWIGFFAGFGGFLSGLGGYQGTNFSVAVMVASMFAAAMVTPFWLVSLAVSGSFLFPPDEPQRKDGPK